MTLLSKYVRTNGKLWAGDETPGACLRPCYGLSVNPAAIPPASGHCDCPQQPERLEAKAHRIITPTPWAQSGPAIPLGLPKA